MKIKILFLLLTFSAAIANSQKTTVKISEFSKNKKTTGIEGLFTIKGKPFLIVGESNRMIVDYSAAFYPIESDNSLGEVIRQENVNIIDGMMQLEKCIYVENIIVTEGKTLLFYSKRNGKKAKVFYVELDEECQIKEEDAVEVMDLQLSTLNKSTNFAVQQSPDRKKILLVGMNAGTNKSCKFTFKVYNSGMSSLIWEKELEAPETNDSYPMFKGFDYFNTELGPNHIYKSNFLINDAGRVYFLEDKVNPAGNKHEMKFVSIEPSGKNINSVEISGVGEYFSSYLFRLNKNGDANLMFFYSKIKKKVEVSNDWGAKINAFLALNYDGTKSTVIADYEISDEQQSQFFPSKNRKPKADYRIGGFEITKALEMPDGGIALMMNQSFSTVGTERPMSNTSHGYVCVVVLDSAYKFKSLFSFTRINYPNKIRMQITVCNKLFLIDGKLHLLNRNEDDALQLFVLDTPMPKAINVNAKYAEQECTPLLENSAYMDGAFLIPVAKEKMYGVSELKR